MIAWQLGGTMLAVTGVGTLYLAWRRRDRDWLLVGLGWAFVLIAIVLWSKTGGVDKGPALGIVTVTLVGLVAVAIRAVSAPIRQGRPTVQRSVAPAAGIQLGVHRYGAALNVMAMVFAGLAVSIAACTALFMGNRALGIEHTSNLALTMFSFPILWGVIATYIGYSSSVRGRFVRLLGIAAVAILIIVLSMGAA